MEIFQKLNPLNIVIVIKKTICFSLLVHEYFDWKINFFCHIGYY